jgi:hypothetical protein
MEFILSAQTRLIHAIKGAWYRCGKGSDIPAKLTLRPSRPGGQYPDFRIGKILAPGNSSLPQNGSL